MSQQKSKYLDSKTTSMTGRDALERNLPTCNIQDASWISSPLQLRSTIIGNRLNRERTQTLLMEDPQSTGIPANRLQHIIKEICAINPQAKAQLKALFPNESQKLLSTLEVLPPEIREKIFLPCVVSWNGKTPALIVALRPNKNLYGEALELFYRHNYFLLNLQNLQTLCSLAGNYTLRNLFAENLKISSFFFSQHYDSQDLLIGGHKSVNILPTIHKFEVDCEVYNEHLMSLTEKNGFTSSVAQVLGQIFSRAHNSSELVLNGIFYGYTLKIMHALFKFLPEPSSIRKITVDILVATPLDTEITEKAWLDYRLARMEQQLGLEVNKRSRRVVQEPDGVSEYENWVWERESAFKENFESRMESFRNWELEETSESMESTESS